MIDKIKVNVDYNTYHSIIRDIDLFCFYKKNKEINKNYFLNKILLGIYNFSEQKNKEIVSSSKKIYSHINSNNEELTSLIKYITNMKNDNLFYASRDFYFMIYPGKQFNNFYTNIELEETKNKYSLSKYLFTCLRYYLSFNGASRQIFFKYQEFLLISKAIQSNKMVYICDDEKERIISPLFIGPDIADLNSYIVGYDEKNKEIYIKEIYKIINVFALNKSTTIPKKIISSIDKIIDDDLYYYDLQTYEVAVYFTNQAKKISSSVTFNEPRILKRKGNTFVFNDTIETIVDYLKIFGDTIKVQDKTISNKLKEFYKNGYNAFNN